MGGVESGGGSGVHPGYGAEEDSADVWGSAVSGMKERRGMGAARRGTGPSCWASACAGRRGEGRAGGWAGGESRPSGPKSEREKRNPYLFSFPIFQPNFECKFKSI